MRWKRRSGADSDVDTGDGAHGAEAGGGGSEAVRIVPPSTVLEELSSAFDPEGNRPADSPRTTISIGGDDILPDAVYLDESGDDSRPLFIDDDGSADALDVETAAPRSMEPRIRQRRIGVKREAGRRRLKWAIAIGVVLVAVIAVLAVLGSSLFSVNEVAVSGAVYTDKTRLQAVVDDIEGTPVLLVDTDAAEAALEAIPWVESARVRTHLPDQVTIEIRERTPIASMQGVDGKFRVLDAEGRVLDSIDGQPVALIWISGSGTLDLAPGQFAPAGPAAAASLVTKLTPDIRGRVQSLVVTPDGTDLRMILSHTASTGDELTPIEVRFGSALGDNEQIEKLVRLTRQLEDVGDESVSVIDVSTAEGAVVGGS